MINKLLRTIATNWIHIVGFYFTTYLSLVLLSFFKPEEDGWTPIILTGFVAALLLFVVYGFVVAGWFYLAIIIMDSISFSWTNKWIKETLIIEWLIISIPFIYWAFEYEYWLWMPLSVSFLITQMIRKKKIERLWAVH